MNKKEIRKQERQWRREHKRNQENEQMSGLKSYLQQILPAGMVPGNVGKMTDVMWPFTQVVTIDFGIDPIYGPQLRQSANFQVTQEACLLLTKIQRKSYSYDTAGELAPLQVNFRDLQSTRQLNDNPIPLQQIGRKGFPTIFPTPYLILPNGKFEVEMTSWLVEDMAAEGNGKHDFIFEGTRIRIEDQDKVLSTIFG